MKLKQTAITSVALIFAAFVITSCARNLSTADVPAAVRSAFAKTYPTATDVDWEDEKGNFEAEFKLNGQELGVTYLASGVVYEVEQEVAQSQLPTAINQAIEKEFGQVKEFEEIAKIERGGQTMYEVEFKAGKKEHELLYSAQGEKLSQKNNENGKG